MVVCLLVKVVEKKRKIQMESNNSSGSFLGGFSNCSIKLIIQFFKAFFNRKTLIQYDPLHPK
jgi:hypothetical protein